MWKKILNTGIVAGFLYLLCVYTGTIGVCPAGTVQEAAKICMDIVNGQGIKGAGQAVLELARHEAAGIKGVRRTAHPAQVPQIMDIIIDDYRSTALCADGSVWTWKNRQGKAYAHLIGELENIKQILCARPALYALSEDGFVYVWGSNELSQVSHKESRQNDYVLPTRIDGFSDIKELGVNTYTEGRRGRVFAADRAGNLFTYGTEFYGDRKKNYEPEILQDRVGCVGNIQKIYMGSGNNSFFLREDGTVFSIIDISCWKEEMKDCIFPSLDGTERYPLRKGGWTDLNVDALGTFSILYEMGDGEEVMDIAADPYTMFLYKSDNTLWYWDNPFIEYHNCSMEKRPKDSIGDYSGSFKEVNVKEILGTDEAVQIVRMCAGKENILFLTGDGQAFISSYVTAEVRYTKDMEYYEYDSYRDEWNYAPQMHSVLAVKDIGFQKLDWENIISINTDGEYHFSAVDSEGNYFYLCTEVQ